jgi:O-antigen/teichoic acid export membrane protein
MSVRVGLTTIDQCVSSVSNFAVGVVVARVAGIAGLGAFSLVYAGWLAVAAMHRALITDPMAIEGDLRKPDARAQASAGFAAEMVLGAVGGVIFAVIGSSFLAAGESEFGLPFVAVAPWIPFLVAQDYWRWVGFMKAEPGKSLANDIVFDVVQGVGFALLLVFGIHSSVLAIAAWGAGAAAGAGFGLWQFWVRPGWRAGFGRLRLRWGLGKWIAGVNGTAWGAAQSYLVLAGAFLGPAALGGLKAATSLVSGPALVLIQAGGSVGLPEASRGLNEKGWLGLRRVVRVVAVAGVASMLLVALVVVLFGKRLLEVLYGHEFGQFATTADLLALSSCVATGGLGAILSLKTTKQTGRLFRVSVVSLTVSVVAVSVLTPIVGINGAALALLCTNAVTTILQLVLHARYARREAEALFAAGGAAIDVRPEVGEFDAQTGAGEVAVLSGAGEFGAAPAVGGFDAAPAVGGFDAAPAAPIAASPAASVTPRARSAGKGSTHRGRFHFGKGRLPPGFVQLPRKGTGDPQALDGLEMDPQALDGLEMDPQALDGLEMDPQALDGLEMDPQALDGLEMDVAP